MTQAFQSLEACNFFANSDFGEYTGSYADWASLISFVRAYKSVSTVVRKRRGVMLRQIQAVCQYGHSIAAPVYKTADCYRRIQIHQIYRESAVARR